MQSLLHSLQASGNPANPLQGFTGVLSYTPDPGRTSVMFRNNPPFPQWGDPGDRADAFLLLLPLKGSGGSWGGGHDPSSLSAYAWISRTPTFMYISSMLLWQIVLHTLDIQSVLCYLYAHKSMSRLNLHSWVFARHWQDFFAVITFLHLSLRR